MAILGRTNQGQGYELNKIASVIYTSGLLNTSSTLISAKLLGLNNGLRQIEELHNLLV